MKRKILCILLVCYLLLLSGCRESVPPQVNLSATEPSITAVEPTAGTTESTTTATEPEETQTTETATTPAVPQATEPSKPEPTIPKPTEPATSETVPPELPTEETVPPTTEPEQTQPADSTSKETAPTEPKLEQIDILALEAYGRSYASSTYGYNGTSACSPNTGAGYFPGATKEIPTMEDGYELVRQAIDAQYYRDIACGYLPYEDIDGVIVRCPINICIESTGRSGVYIIWVYYGGYA